MLHVYFKGCLDDLEGFVPDKQYPNAGTCDGFRFQFADGRWRIELSNYNDPVPSWLTVAVEEVSLHDFLPREMKRESGIYRYESAEAEVESCEGGRKTRIRIRARNLNDIRELLRKIKTGVVRPDESYEGQQQGRSRQELEATVTHLEAKLDRFSRVYLSLLGRRWPWLSRSKVLDWLSRV